VSWKKWLHGLMAALIGGAATAAGGALGAMAAGVDVFALLFWKIVGGAAVFGGLTSMIGYLKQSPLPVAPPLNLEKIEPPK
jgi:hypothetical protein